MKKPRSRAHVNRGKTARLRAAKKAKHRKVRLRKSSGERKTYR